MKRSAWTKGLMAVAAVLILIGLGELALRIYVGRWRDPSERFNPAQRTFELVPGRYPRSGGTLVVNANGFAGPPLEVDPARRIVALGDSCTIGEGDGRISYPAMLRHLVQDRQPGTEVVNAGLSGLDSEWLLRRLEHAVLPLEPDVLLVFAGWNDLMKRRPLSQGAPTALARISRGFDNLWLTRGLRKFGGFYLRPHWGAPLAGDESHTGRFTDFRPIFFENHLQEIVKRAQSEGVAVFLMTLPTVLRRDMQPYDLKVAGVVFPYFAGGNRLGDTIDLIEAHNRSIREVGRKTGGHVVDLAERFARLPTTRGYFLDTMHPSREGMKLIAEAVDRALQRASKGFGVGTGAVGSPR